MKKYIEFTGTDGNKYKFENSIVSKEWEPRQLTLIQQFVELSKKYQSINTVEGARGFAWVSDFAIVFFDLIAIDFCKEYPDHIISSEYSPIYGLSSHGKAMLSGLIGNKLTELAELLFKQVSEDKINDEPSISNGEAIEGNRAQGGSRRGRPPKNSKG